MKKCIFIYIILFIFLFDSCEHIPKEHKPTYSTIVYNNNLWLTLDSDGANHTSFDGISWTNSRGYFLPLHSAAYGNNKWLVIGQGDIALSSTDGISWIKTPVENDSILKSITYANNTWMGVGIASNGNGTISASSNSQTWTRQQTSYYKLNCITYGNNMWIAAGDNGTIMTSSDGITWIIRPSGTTARLNSVIYDNNIWIITVQDNIVLTSADGISWARNSIGNGHLYSVAYGNNLWVGVGVEGDGYGFILTSPDGTSWTKRMIIYSKYSWLNSVAYGNNKWITVGCRGTMLTSTDGVTWEIQ